MIYRSHAHRKLGQTVNQCLLETTDMILSSRLRWRHQTRQTPQVTFSEALSGCGVSAAPGGRRQQNTLTSGCIDAKRLPEFISRTPGYHGVNVGG